jgi:transposase-like protein
MAKKARKYSVGFKREAVRQMAKATTIVGLAEKLGVLRKLLYQWRDQLPDPVTLEIVHNQG